MAGKKRIVYKLLGLGRMSMHLFWIFASIFGMVFGVYYDKNPEQIPSSLEWLYKNADDVWQWLAMINMTFWFVGIVGFFCVFMGWKMMHPLEIKNVDIQERRKTIIQKSAELKEQIQKSK